MKIVLYFRRLMSVLFAGGLMLGLLNTAKALEPDQVFAKVSPSIVEVIAGDSTANLYKQGSGVVIKNERVVTNCHVLTKTKTIIVKWKDAKLFASLEYPDVERDLCEIKVPSLKAPPVQIAPKKSLRIGERVYAIGNPMGLELSLSDGLISSFRMHKGVRYIQTNADITHGSSGGGLFDNQGRLIGITSRGIKDAGINFAVPASYIKELPARGKAEMKKLLSEKSAKPRKDTSNNAVTKPATQTGQLLTGAQIKKIFSPGLEMYANPRGHLDYTITIEGSEYVDRYCGGCNLSDDDGQMKINFVAGQICFDWSRATYPTSGCFTVELVDRNDVRLHLVGGDEVTKYRLKR